MEFITIEFLIFYNILLTVRKEEKLANYKNFIAND